MSDLQNHYSEERLYTAPWCFIFNYPLLVSFRLQIAYRKAINSWIGVNKLVGEVLINLLHHAKFIMSLKVSRLCNQHNYRCTCCVEVVHLNRFTSIFCYYNYVPYCVSVLVLTSGCKLAPAQYKRRYYLPPSQSILTKQI